MSIRDEMTRAMIADDASEWYLLNRSRELTSAERADFTSWLRASPLNVREYLAVAAMANDLAIATEGPASELEALIQEARRQPSQVVVPLAMRPRAEGPANRGDAVARSSLEPSVVFRSKTALLTAVAAAIVSVSAILFLFSSASNSFQTAHGEQRTVRLPDGSLMHLNSGSKASLHYTDSQRVIDVDRGQLMFEVAGDPSRPFRVRAGGAEIVVLGTKFDVYRKPGEVAVTVIEGRVRVSRISTLSSPLGLSGRGKGRSAAAHPPVELIAGQQLRWGVQGSSPVPLKADMASATAWLQGDIRFLRQPLGEVAAEFSRYSPLPIEIDDGTLYGLRVSGVFNAYDTESFLEFVTRLEGVSVQSDSRRIRVVSRK